MIGTTISHYKIIEKIGEGGMGEVYLAEDMELDRKVALKFLPLQYTEDPEINARFKREAKAAAALNHPNIITIHEIGEDEGKAFISMEHVEGQSLKQLLSDQKPSIDQVIEISTQICEGLSRAHQAGIVHRDIKPGNILLDSEGRVKIADFGLAKVTGHTRLTLEGSTLGTLDYMSPEQLNGADVDHRSDIWSFGVMLYEMITGELPFKGEYDGAVVYSIVHDKPEPMSHYKCDIPEYLQSIIDKALQKDLATRYQDTASLLANLKGISINRSVLTIRKLKPKRSYLINAAFSALFIIILVTSVYLLTREPAKQIPATHTQVTFAGDVSWPALSPDGQFMAYVTGVFGAEQKLFVQDLSGGQPLEIFRDQRVMSPRWSPDGTEIFFFASNDSDRANYILPRLGGQPQRVEIRAFLYSWSPDGSQLAGGAMDLDFIRIYSRATGEESTIKIDTTFTWFLNLDWSPTGNWFLFLSQHAEKYTIWTISMKGKSIQKLVEDDAPLFCPRWSPNGDAIYYFKSQDQTKDLMKIAVDRKTGTRKGNASTIQSGLQTGNYFTLSKDGKSLLYTRKQESSNLWSVTVEDTEEDDQRTQTKQLTTGTSVIKHPSVSPDGAQLVFSVENRPGTANIFTMPVDGSELQQLTFFESRNYKPAWSPDGKQVAFGSTQGEGLKVWLVSAAGGTPRQFSQTKLSAEFQLRWAPSTDILYQRPAGANFHFLNAKTEEERPLLETISERDWPVGRVSVLHEPRFSPDAQKLAVYWIRWPSGKAALTEKDSTGLWVISLKDNSQRFLYKLALPGTIAPIGWLPDGQWIYAVEQRGSENKANIVMINEETALAKKLVTLPFSPHAVFDTDDNIWFTMTPNGKKVIFPVFDKRSDVWLMENFESQVE